MFVGRHHVFFIGIESNLLPWQLFENSILPYPLTWSAFFKISKCSSAHSFESSDHIFGQYVICLNILTLTSNFQGHYKLLAKVKKFVQNTVSAITLKKIHLETSGLHSNVDNMIAHPME